LTNQDIYDGNFEKIVFTAVITKKLKKLFDSKFEEYKQNVHKLKDISSETIT